MSVKTWAKAWMHHPFCHICRRDIAIHPDDPWFPNAHPFKLIRAWDKVRTMLHLGG